MRDDFGKYLPTTIYIMKHNLLFYRDIENIVILNS